MDKKRINYLVSACAVLVAPVAAGTYNVDLGEYRMAGGSFDDAGQCPGSWFATNGTYTRTDVASSVAGSLKSGTTSEGSVSHCGECPVGTVSIELSASYEGTNTSTLHVAASVEGGGNIGIVAVKAAAESGMEWADGSIIEISGSAQISGIEPCQFQKGIFTFDYYEDKGRKVSHNYNGEALATFEPSDEECPYEKDDIITGSSPSTETTNLGDHYHSTNTNYESTEGGTCSGCVPGDHPDCDEEEPPEDDGDPPADNMPSEIPA